MTDIPVSPLVTGALASLLRGEGPPWRTVGVTPTALLDLCAEEDLTGLVHRELSRLPHGDWPEGLSRDLAHEARAEETREMVRRRELTGVLDVLAAAGIHPILFKGTPLAYLAYESPGLRPRSDTDLLIRRDQTDSARRIVEGLGYEAPPYCDGELLFCQFELQRTDQFGVCHALDFHWKISMQSLFANLLDFDELERDSLPVPALGPHARAPEVLHALLLACIHPAMHHRNAERLIWLYDVHVLVSRLTPGELGRFIDLASSKGVAAICAHELGLARQRLGTRVSDETLRELASRGRAEPTAVYLKPQRRWHDELVSNVKGLGRWGDRLRLLKEVAFPSPRYMLQSYGWSDTVFSRVLLPALYVHRGVRGGMKVVLGKK